MSDGSKVKDNNPHSNYKKNTVMLRQSGQSVGRLESEYKNCVDAASSTTKKVNNELNNIIDSYEGSKLKQFEKNTNIFFSVISSIVVDAGRKGAPSATKRINQECYFYNKINLEKIKTINLKCSVFKERFSEQNTANMKSFFESNKYSFEKTNVENDYSLRVAYMSFDLNIDNKNQYSFVKTCIDTSLNNIVKTKLNNDPWVEFQIKIYPSNLPEGELKTALANHLNQKVIKNDKKINSFSEDITDIINQSFQKYLEENKLTFDAKDASSILADHTKNSINSISME